MGYRHIDNLYKNQTIMAFRECYALEKIHGTSAHIKWDGISLSFFSGGEKHERFVALFDQEALKTAFIGFGYELATFTVYGEAYGGKMQGMSKTYGTELRFVVFDIKISDAWLNVPNANDVATKLGLEFVHYQKVSTDLAMLDIQRDLPSEQALRNGITEFKIREGVVLRPLDEFRDKRGNRILAKHKRPEFRERKSIPEVDPAKKELMEKADDIADEWVTPMRLTHVLDKIGNPNELKAIPDVIKAMTEDVCREAEGLIVDNKIVRKAISQATVKLFKSKVMKVNHE